MNANTSYVKMNLRAVTGKAAFNQFLDCSNLVCLLTVFVYTHTRTHTYSHTLTRTHTHIHSCLYKCIREHVFEEKIAPRALV